MDAILQNSSLRKDLIFYSKLDEWNRGRDMISGTLPTETAVYPVLDKKGNGRRWLEPLTASPFSSHSAIAAFGTGNFTIIRKVKTGTIGTAQSLTGGATNSFDFYISAAGYLTVIKFGGSALTASTTLLTANTEYVLSYIRSGTTTGTYYVNGTPAGTCTDANDYTVGCTLRGSGTGYFLGFDYMSRVFNFALTPTVQLINYSKPEYPIEAVYRGFSGINPGVEILVNYDFASGGSGWSAVNWSFSGGKAINSGFSNSLNQNTGIAAANFNGRTFKIRIKIDNYTSGDPFVTMCQIGVIYPVISASGIYEYIYTVNGAISGYMHVQPNGANAFDVDYYSIVQLGCLLDLNASGMSSATWVCNTCGITATNSGTYFNLPAASDLGANYFNGTTSKVVDSRNLNLVTDQTIAFKVFIFTKGGSELGFLFTFGNTFIRHDINYSYAFSRGADPKLYTSQNSFPILTWLNVAIVSQGTTTTIYVNNVVVGTGTIGAATTAANNYIGCFAGTSYFSNMIMKDFTIWSRNLTLDEIAFINAT